MTEHKTREYTIDVGWFGLIVGIVAFPVAYLLSVFAIAIVSAFMVIRAGFRALVSWCSK